MGAGKSPFSDVASEFDEADQSVTVGAEPRPLTFSSNRKGFVSVRRCPKIAFAMRHNQRTERRVLVSLVALVQEKLRKAQRAHL